MVLRLLMPLIGLALFCTSTGGAWAQSERYFCGEDSYVTVTPVGRTAISAGPIDGQTMTMQRSPNDPDSYLRGDYGVRFAADGQSITIEIPDFGEIGCVLRGNGGQADSQPQAGPNTVVPDPVYLDAIATPVGKWPEGLAFDGANIWVAESGQRTIAALDPARLRVRKRVRVGRLPVDMASDTSSNVYISVVTDQIVRRLRARGQSAPRLARSPGYADGMVYTGGQLWILTWPDGSSGSVQAVQMEPASGRTYKLRKLVKGVDYQGNNSDFAVVEGKVWITYWSGELIIQDIAAPNNTERQDNPLVRLASVAGHEGKVAIAGWKADNENIGIVAVFDAVAGRPVKGHELPQKIVKVIGAGGYFIAFGARDSLFVIDAATGGLVRHIIATTPMPEPKSAIAVGDALYVASHAGNGDNGTVFTVRGWVPR